MAALYEGSDFVEMDVVLTKDQQGLSIGYQSGCHARHLPVES